jgi:hypothetical protein
MKGVISSLMVVLLDAGVWIGNYFFKGLKFNIP